ncbi:Cullin-4A, partial [Coemansia sp. RSA 2603]
EIYEMLQVELESYTRKQLSEINSRAADSTTNEKVLEQSQIFWTGYIQQLDMIRCVFLYLDRTYVLQTANVLSLWAMGLNTVKRYLVETDMKSRLIRLVIGEITKERDSKVVDRIKISALVNMFIELGLYVPYFMPVFIESTREYYQRESRRMVRDLVPVIVSDTMQIDEPQSGAMDVPSRLEQESERIESYLYADSKTVLLATVRMEMIEKHTDRLLSSSFDAMADADMIADLSNLYALLAAVNRLDSLKKVWASYIKKTGLRLLQAPDLDVSLVTDLLALKQRLDDILH